VVRRGSGVRVPASASPRIPLKQALSWASRDFGRSGEAAKTPPVSSLKAPLDAPTERDPLGKQEFPGSNPGAPTIFLKDEPPRSPAKGPGLWFLPTGCGYSSRRSAALLEETVVGLELGFESHGPGQSGRPANPNLDRLLEHLMEPVGRQARRRAAEAIRRVDREASR
jgi:hypothetical protein